MGRKKSNVVHSYFIYDSEKNTSSCTKCSKVLQGNHSTNLLQHFHFHHYIDYEEITKTNQSIRNLRKHVNENKPSAEIIKCCVDLIIVHGRPFSLIDDDAFQELLKMIPGTKGLSVSAKSIKVLIIEKAYEIRKEIFNEIKKQLISLKADVGSINKRRFLGLNVQYTQEDEIVMRNLGVIELHQSDTGKHLKDAVTCVLDQYGIEIKQIYSMTTDNGSYSNIHSTSRQMQEGELEQEIVYYPEELSPIDEEEYEKILNDLQMLFDEAPCDLSPKVSAVRCAAHTLYLAINDALKERKELLETVREAVRALRAPNIVTQLRNLNLPEAEIDRPTKWDSTTEMLERIMTLKMFCQTNSDHRINLTDFAWCNIEEILNALIRCRFILKRLQNHQLTFGDFYISWTQCIFEIEKLATPFAFILVSYMKRREITLFESESFLAAMYLDPRVNFILEKKQLATARNHLTRTFKKLVNVNLTSSARTLSQIKQNTDNLLPRTESENDENSNTSVNSSSTLGSNTADSLKKLDDFLDTLYRARHQNGAKTEIDINSHLIEFLKEPILKSGKNILEYWREKKLTDVDLYSLANVILSTPATPVSVECFFSSLKFVIYDLEMSLQDKHLNDVLVLRNNYLSSSGKSKNK